MTLIYVGDQTIPNGLDLYALHAIHIPALCMGRIPHGTLETDGLARVWIVRVHGTMLDRSLIVDQGPVTDGELWTDVFNLSSQPQIIRKGDFVSRLVQM